MLDRASSTDRSPHGATILAFAPLRPRSGGEDDLHFTLQDRIEIAAWSRACRFGRVLIEPGQRGAGPDRASFALIYLRDDPWSRWGVHRGPYGIVTWCCRSGADVALNPTMTRALTNLPLV